MKEITQIYMLGKTVKNIIENKNRFYQLKTVSIAKFNKKLN